MYFVIKTHAYTWSSNLLKLSENKAARLEEMVMDFWLLSLFPNYTSKNSSLTFTHASNHTITESFRLEGPQRSPSQTPDSSLFPLLHTFSCRKAAWREGCRNSCGTTNSLALPKPDRWESSAHYHLSSLETAPNTETHTWLSRD